ncbi:MAG: exo-alpha-sialidase [Armatimonadetes bacterium]|nr:exo-alpha-sialidase [Armatimonadota bacterium]
MSESQPARRGAITITRENDLKVDGQRDWVSAESYASLEQEDLIRAVSTQDGSLMLRSQDRGRSWTPVEGIGPNKPLDASRHLHTSVATLCLDPDNGMLVRFLTEAIESAREGDIPYADAVGMGPHFQRVYYEVSRDGGRNWGPRQLLIEQGAEYDEQHWARDVWYGQSSLILEGRRLHRLPDGTIVAPCYLWPTKEHIERIFAEEARPQELWDDAVYYVQSVCLLGRWREDLSGIDWQSGGPILLQGGYTPAGTCGSDEPTLAFLDDGKWLAVLRTSTSHVQEFRDKNIPFLRQCSVSTDNGMSWHDARSLTFGDGSPVYSSSAYSEFIRSSKTGNWYWIGNVLDVPTFGDCDPRYPLQIVELDPLTLKLKRDTLTVIEDKGPEDLERVRFSNFRIYEERGSGDFVLLMTKGYSELQEGYPNLPFPSYRYRIQLPD